MDGPEVGKGEVRGKWAFWLGEVVGAVVVVDSPRVTLCISHGVCRRSLNTSFLRQPCPLMRAHYPSEIWVYAFQVSRPNGLVMLTIYGAGGREATLLRERVFARGDVSDWQLLPGDCGVW